MQNNNYFFIATFSVALELSARFREWMERTHFPDMHKTGCFLGKPQIITCTTSTGRVHIVYIYTLASETMWEKFQKNYRPQLRAEFMKQFDDYIKADELQVIMTNGYQTELEVL